jgi:hypothetical protein
MAADPTVPNVIRVPLTVPVSLSVCVGAESVIRPLTLDPCCCQLRVNVPEKAPQYRPDHLPDRSLPVAGVDETAGEVGVDFVPVDVRLAFGGGLAVSPVVPTPISSGA